MAEREKCQALVMSSLKGIIDKAMETGNLQAAFDATCKMYEVSYSFPTEQQGLYRSADLAPDEFVLAKADEEARMVFGWANQTKTAKGETIVDAHGDYIETVDLEKAAYEHVLKFRATGESHRGGVKGVLVESIVFTPEKIEALGLAKGSLPEGWWVGYRVDDEQLWQDVKKGKFRSFSVQGMGEVE